MARIRTIKPEFFTSADICGLSPLARLLYIALWCEADREGRMEWKPPTFKLRYFPGDACDINALSDEIVNARLIVLYGEGLAYIPKFSNHQHVNPRESASVLPEPNKSTRQARVGTRHTRDSDAQVGREGKGKEGEGKEDQSSTGARVAARPTKKCPESFAIEAGHREWAKEHAPAVDIDAETAKFRDHTFGTARADWDGTWRNWMRKSQERAPSTNGRQPPSEPAWRTEQRDRVRQFAGPFAAKAPGSGATVIDMEEIPDAATRQLG